MSSFDPPGEQLRPLSAGQRRLWFLDQLERGNPVYNVPLILRWSGPLDVGVLGRCVVEVVRRHEVLRTGFVVGSVGVRQRVFEVPVVDLPVVESVDGENLLGLLAREARRPFDLSRGPMVRGVVVRLGGGGHVVMFTFHHVATDGWSVEVFRRELSVLYEAFSAGLGSPLPELPIQYGDYAAWQDEQVSSGAMDGDVAYWRDRLAGAPARMGLPADRMRPVQASYRGAMASLELGAELSDGLRAFSRREGATLFMTVLTGFTVLLSRYTGERDVVVGTAIAGRLHPELANLIGFFMNLLVMRTDVSGDPTVRELVARVRQVCVDAYAHQEVPFDRLVEQIRPERTAGTNPLFQVLFTFEDALFPVDDDATGDRPRTTVLADDVFTGTAKFDLEIAVVLRDRPEIRCVYSTDLFDETTIQRMMRHYRRLLEAMVTDPDLRLSELPILDQTECDQAVTGFNAPDADYPRDRGLHELVEDRVMQDPGAIAVVGGSELPSYAELNQRANQAVAANSEPESAGTAPRSADDIEGRVAEVWAAALAVAEVGMQDNFFDLGGHSMLLIEVRGRLRDELGVAVSLVDLYSYPTVSALAAHIRSSAGGQRPAEGAEPRTGRREAAAERSRRLRAASADARERGE